MKILGIDPGVNGGLAVVGLNGDELAMKCVAMPRTEIDIRDWIAASGASVAYVEVVHSFPGAGVASMFTFGASYGFLRGVVLSHGIPLVEVAPRKWQAEFVSPASIPRCPKNATATERKRWKTLRYAMQRDHKHKLLQKAKNLFPNVRISLAVADAVLIAEYGRREWSRTMVQGGDAQ